MEATATGPNRTGAALHPKDVEQMLEAVDELSPPVPINTMQMDVERQSYISEAQTLGSIPPPPQAAKKGAKKAAAPSAAVALLMDKLGERIAFERTGTRLYGALISKHLALLNAGQKIPPTVTDEPAGDALQRIRAEELGHFHLLCSAVMEMGGDPTAQTPCADVIGAASSGLMQVITDPRTTFAQSLNAILTAELTDNAGWEMLITLAEAAGQSEMAKTFATALDAEQQHVLIVRGWLETLMQSEIGTPAV